MALTNFNKAMTAGDLVSLIGVEIGLPKVQDPFTSADPQYQRMINILNVAGNTLLKLYPWIKFQNLMSITTAPGQGTYALPTDFDSMIDETMWQANTSFITGFGSVGPQMWEYFLNVPVVGTLTIIYRERSGVLQILPIPTASFAFTFEYVSRGWVQQGAAPNQVYRDNVVNASDLVLFDSTLIGRYLKLRFLEALGFDTQGAKDDFNLMLDAVSSQDKSAQTISAARGLGTQFRLIDSFNAPETGYGF